MKELIAKIQREMVKIVSKAMSFISALILIMGCSILKNTNKLDEDIYTIIERESYTPGSLYYKTIPYEELIAKESFTYQNINENNYHTSILVEEERYINFDTVFSPEKRREITERFQSLRKIKLKKSLMKHPESLSKTTRLMVGEPSESRGTNGVTYPFIVEGEKGELYGFFYRYPLGNLYIFRKTQEGWKKVAVVHIIV